MPPLVSVLIPTYNGAERIGDALRSVVAQTVAARDRKALEIVVVVDGSTDGTDAVLEAFARESLPRETTASLRVLRQENQGAGVALNRALATVESPFVALLDDDDTWRPRKLEVQLDYLERHPEVIGCSVPWETSARPGVSVVDRRTVCQSNGEAEGIVDRPIRRHFDAVFWRPSFVLMRREATEGLRFAPVRSVPYDREFDLAFFARGPLGIASDPERPDEPLGTYRIHDANVSRSRMRGVLLTRRLRALVDEGAFEDGVFRDFDAAQRRDFEHFMGRRARHGILELLQVGERRAALDLWRRERRSLVHAGSAAFALAAPFLALAPSRVSRRLADRLQPSRGVLHA